MVVTLRQCWRSSAGLWVVVLLAGCLQETDSGGSGGVHGASDAGSDGGSAGDDGDGGAGGDGGGARTDGAGEDGDAGSGDVASGADAAEAGTDSQGDAPECQPACSDRACGPDPVCGVSCGACEGSCQDDGSCLPAESGPRILALDTNLDVVTSSDLLVVTVVVTDPDGIDDLIGGRLVDADNGATYAAFATSAAEGAYTQSLSWGMLHDVEPIFAGVDGVTRTLVAEFFDVAGHSTSAQVSITLACEDAGLSICDGLCFDLQTDPENCGECGRTVVGEEQFCYEGYVSAVLNRDFGTNCQVACEAELGHCEEADWSYCPDAPGCGVYIGSDDGHAVWTGRAVGCDEEPPATVLSGGVTHTFSELWCWCRIDP